jgi:hypothetical protein
VGGGAAPEKADVKECAEASGEGLAGPELSTACGKQNLD